jgi:hypothetical protein
VMMSDDFRDRLALTLERADRTPRPYIDLAEAVIAEFGFHIDRVGTLRRYVSGWSSDNGPYCLGCGRPHGEGECLRPCPGRSHPPEGVTGNDLP